MAKTRIYEQQQALSVYFRDMLADPGHMESLPASEPVVTTPAATAKVTTQHDVSVDIDTESHQQAVPELAANETPAISQAETSQKLLLCDIGGMSLAIAVSELNNIVHWPEQGLTHLPGSADWQLGILSDRQQHSEIIDVRGVLQTPDTGRPAAARYILLVDERRRGIACDRIQQIIQIDNDKVNWRQDQSQRPWFTGVIADSMHSIVDIPALLAALESS